MRHVLLITVMALMLALTAGAGFAANSSRSDGENAQRAGATRQLTTYGKQHYWKPILERHRRAHNFEAYDWTQVYAPPLVPTSQPGSYWEPRAGLQVVDIKGVLYLMGGRTPVISQIFGDSFIHGDVWRSTDDGESWHEIVSDTDAQGDWPARAYFSAVKKGHAMYVLGGQNFKVIKNPVPCDGEAPVGGPPPGVVPATGVVPQAPPEGPPAGGPPEGGPPGGGAPACPEFVSDSDFFADVWKSYDGVNWKQLTADAGWEGRAGLSAVVFKGAIYVFGGSTNDDSAVIPGTVREYFNDVWRSYDGKHWKRLTADAPWAKRAGAAAVVKNGYIYLLGGEAGFVGPYFNDVWRSKDGKHWQLVTAEAGWSKRPGHKCGVIVQNIVCFGGFGLVENPADIWVSRNGKHWRQTSPPGELPWGITDADDARYDFALVARRGSWKRDAAILTFGGDRTRFDRSPIENAMRVDGDVWRYAPPAK